MNSSHRLSEALHDLRDEHRRIQPPPQILAHVQAAVVPASQPDSPRRLWTLAFAACTFLFLCLFSGTILQFEPQPSLNYSSAQMEPASESTTGLIPLPSSAGLPPPQATSLLRVRLQESELRQFGLEFSEPFSTRYTQVEFVVGEDGLARAVRFVQPASTGTHQ
jgi:hypothetical protein